VAPPDRPWIALAEGPPEGPWTIRCPAVGWWIDPPASGSLVGSGSAIGRLRLLNRTAELRLREGIEGRVHDAPGVLRVAVGYGEELLRIVPTGARSEGSACGGIDSGDPSSSLAEGCRAVVAPTDGVFYRGPDPESPPFVQAGDRIRVGEPVGLVEVMKTFNQIVYGGPGLPEEAEVVEVRRADGEEIVAGEILLVVR
jgi:biotin carboxyl carrier protein